MSVLIKGIKVLPKHCFECMFYRAKGQDYDYCCISSAIPKNYIPDDCPLIELPDHGDLKDVNAIIQDVHDDLDGMTKIGIAVDADWIWAKFHDAIYSAPVVIPAERSANGKES